MKRGFAMADEALSPSGERGRPKGSESVIHVAVLKRWGWTSGDHPVWLFPNQELQLRKEVSGRLQRISGV